MSQSRYRVIKKGECWYAQKSGGFFGWQTIPNIKSCDEPKSVQDALVQYIKQEDDNDPVYWEGTRDDVL